jgi:hypothetical protein
MRVQRNANSLVKDFLASSATDITVEWTPPYASLKKLRDMFRLSETGTTTGAVQRYTTDLYRTGFCGESGPVQPSKFDRKANGVVRASCRPEKEIPLQG